MLYIYRQFFIPNTDHYVNFHYDAGIKHASKSQAINTSLGIQACYACLSNHLSERQLDIPSTGMVVYELNEEWL